MTASTVVTMGAASYGYDADGRLVWVNVAGEDAPIAVAGEKPPKPPPEIPWECWRTRKEWDAERAHEATQAACRGQR